MKAGAVAAALTALLFTITACQSQPDRPAAGDQQAPAEAPSGQPADPPTDPSADTLVDTLVDPRADTLANPLVPTPGTGAPDPALFLPPLPGYRTDDDVDVGEIRASLDGAVPYAGVRRRLILDEQDFTSGDVMVVTFEAGTGGADRFMRHWFGAVQGAAVAVGDVEMQRIPTQAHDVLAWIGSRHVVVFGRGQAVTDAWLVELARATVTAMRARQS